MVQELFDFSKRLSPLNTGVDFQSKQDFPPCKAIIFDIYGTLLISSSGDIGSNKTLVDIYTIFKKMGVTFNHSSLKMDQFNQIVQTLLQKEIQQDHQIKKSKKIDYPEVNIEEIWKQVIEEIKKLFSLNFPENFNLKYLSIAYENQTNKIDAMPYLKEVIQKIHDLKISLGIVSNAQFFTPLFLNYFLTSEIPNLQTISQYKIPYFDVDLNFYSFRYGVAKPSTFLYENLVNQLALKKIKPEEAWYVGNDILNDIFPAQKMGLTTILFAGDSRSLRWRKNDERVQGVKPDFIINDLNQILTCLGENCEKAN